MLRLVASGGIDLFSSSARHGVGLFETVRVEGGVPLRLAAHLSRLASGASFLALGELPAEGDLLAFASGHCGLSGVALGVMRLYALDGSLYVSCADGLPPTENDAAADISRAVTRLSGSASCRFKTISYLDNALLSREAASRSLFDAIALNERGTLSDGGRSTLFVAIGGELLTPPVSDGALPGIARAALLGSGVAMERSLSPSDLSRAEAALMTNALRLDVPLRYLAGRELARAHPLLDLAKRTLRSP
jgi:branched-chain amino acid aminotransferase